MAKPMSAARRERLQREVEENGNTVYGSYAAHLREALASDALRADMVRKAREHFEYLESAANDPSGACADCLQDTEDEGHAENCGIAEFLRETEGQ